MKGIYTFVMLLFASMTMLAQSSFVPRSWTTSTDENGTVYRQNDGLTL